MFKGINKILSKKYLFGKLFICQIQELLVHQPLYYRLYRHVPGTYNALTYLYLGIGNTAGSV